MSWTVNVKYADATNLLTDKPLLSAAIASVVNYLNQFVNGTGTLDLSVIVEQTATGRFGGSGATYVKDQHDGLVFVGAEAARELASGTDQNNGAADMMIYIDPTTNYFKSLAFDTLAYTAPPNIPTQQVDGLTVLLHEIMHGLGINSYRNYATGSYDGQTYRTEIDVASEQSGQGMLLTLPSFAAHGLKPIEVTSTSVSQNYSHIGNQNDLKVGYVDDLMNGLYFVSGHRYYMSQIDLMMLEGLGYSVQIPDSLPLSYSQMSGVGQTFPTIAAGQNLSALTTNKVHLTGQAAAGSTTSIIEHGKLLGSTLADAGGHWALDVTLDPALASSAEVARDGTLALDSAAQAVARAPGAGYQLFGSNVYTHIVGGGGNDVITGGAGDNIIDAGGGRDTAVYAGNVGDFTVTHYDNGYTVVDNKGGEGYDALHQVERLHFADANMALDIDGIGGQAYRIYQAAFNRTPDRAGLGFWIGVMDGGVSLDQVAAGFINSDEYRTVYASGLSNTALVSKYYDNVLHRPAEQAGIDFWVGVLDDHRASTAAVLAGISESAENVANLVGVIGNGFIY